MKNIISIAFVMAVMVLPIGYQDWKAGGNTFPAGYQGFVHYYDWLTPENRVKLDEGGKYTRSAAITLDKGGLTLSKWLKDNDSYFRSMGK